MATTTSLEVGRRRSSGAAVSALVLSAVTSLATAQSQTSLQLQTLSRETAPAQAASAPPARTSVPAAPTQRLVIQPSIGLTVTATNNSRLDTDDLPAQRDVVVDLQTNLVMRSRSARFLLDANIGVDFLDYTRNTQSNRVLPHGRLDLNATLIENSLFVDTGVEATRTRSDPFRAQTETGSTANTLSTVVYRLSPYYSQEVIPHLSVLARSDNSFSRSFGDNTGPNANDQLRGARTQYDILRVERKPIPLGFAFEVSRQDQRYTQISGEVLRIDTIRGIGSYAVTPELIGGLIVGRDHSFYSLTEVSDARYGANLHWRPDDRTRLDVEVEHRFFGIGWDLNFQHRSPYTVVTVTTSRYPSASTLSLGAVQTGADLAALLDSLLTTRLPNPADRAAAVQDLIAQRGLTNQIGQPYDVFSDQAQLNRRADVTVLFNGVRNTVTLAAFYAKAEALDRGTVFSANALDTEQRGGSLNLNHRLTPDTTVDLRTRWSSIVGLGERAGNKTIEREASVNLNRALSPRSTAVASLRRLNASSTLSGTVNETALLVGLKVRF